ncbi:MFS transporter [Lysinibacillus sp. Bpr_S20]|uniref:MFS transporter n=1 Tax=Lysinibacillus sp. Bpr_S20 TaxID=2933964 RepID=UPI002011E0E0|nr:MFS transporter [Lysinibacillus sp. Bpr_S20]MCL1702606.1 MFS transporter [Lysinibacillus sp. Bpr_S20]
MSHKHKQSIIAIALITAICLAGDSMLYIVLPTHWRSVGLTSLVQVGIILSINRFVRLPLNPLIGYIYKKISFRNLILFAVLLSGLTTLSYGFIKEYPLWILMRAIWGLSWSLFKLGGYLLVLQYSTNSNRGNLMGTYNGLYRLGSLFGMLLGGFLADLFGIKLIALILGSMVFLSIPLVFKYLPKTLQMEHDNKPLTQTRFTWLKPLQNKMFLKILVTAFLLSMLLDGMLTATLSHIIEEKFTNHIHLFGFIVGAATLSGGMQALRWGITPFLTPKIGDIFDRAKQKNMVLVLCLVSAAIFLFLIPLSLKLVLWLPILLVHLLVASVITTVLDGVATDYASKMTNRLLLMTTYTIILDLGAALGPIAGYCLEQQIGLYNLFWLASTTCLILMILWAIPHKVPLKQNII